MRTAVLVLTTILTLPAAGGKAADPVRKVVVTNPLVTEVVVDQPYVCKMHGQRHIEVLALTAGAIEAVAVREGQAVKKGDVLFQVVPTLLRAKLDAEAAEVRLARLRLDQARKLFDQKVVSQQEVELAEAELAKARAGEKVAEVRLGFATVKAPFDGLVGRLEKQEGSLVREGDALTTLSDNGVMWAYFNVPEARYLELKARQGKSRGDPSRLELVGARIELVLADGSTFAHDPGNVVTVENAFRNETGNVAFRADFPNPDRLLRHGQSGTLLIRRAVKDATVVPQRATFEALDRRYVYVVGKDGVARRREIEVDHEAGDAFVVRKGIDATDTIVLEGVRRVLEGDKVECEYRKPDEAVGRPTAGREK